MRAKLTAKLSGTCVSHSRQYKLYKRICVGNCVALERQPGNFQHTPGAPILKAHNILIRVAQALLQVILHSISAYKFLDCSGSRATHDHEQ